MIKVNKVFSGKLLLRIDQALHNALARRAEKMRVSINTLCAKFLQTGLNQKETIPWWQGEARKLVEPLQKHFGKDLIGVAVFGSYVHGTATEKSDLDILIVLDSQITLQRSFYTWWDENIKSSLDVELAPQFVNLPKDVNMVGSIWLEAATASHIVWERGSRLSDVVDEIRKFIANDGARRYWLSGQPYWVRRG